VEIIYITKWYTTLMPAKTDVW